MHAANTKPRLSVIIPVAPEDSLAPRLQSQLAQFPPDVQLRVVRASDDRRAASVVASDFACRCENLRAARGRASQQNAGAAGAAGDWLWFLHADSEMANDTISSVCSFAERNPGAAGYHELRFHGDGPLAMRLTEAGVWFRSHCFGLPFGDQGLFVRRDVFESVGGFDPLIERGEDHDLVWRLRRAGIPMRPVGSTLYTSARKYAKDGWWSTTLDHVHETWRQARQFSRGGTVR